MCFKEHYNEFLSVCRQWQSLFPLITRHEFPLLNAEHKINRIVLKLIIYFKFSNRSSRNSIKLNLLQLIGSSKVFRVKPYYEGSSRPSLFGQEIHEIGNFNTTK